MFFSSKNKEKIGRMKEYWIEKLRVCQGYFNSPMAYPCCLSMYEFIKFTSHMEARS